MAFAAQGRPEALVQEHLAPAPLDVMDVPAPATAPLDLADGVSSQKLSTLDVINLILRPALD
jgi:hypothetical protein